MLRALKPRVEPYFAAVADAFYRRILDHRDARSAITGGAEQVERLKCTLKDWLNGIFSGPWDEAYYEQRARIGRRHVAISLPQQYMFSAMNVVRLHLTEVIITSVQPGHDVTAELAAANKILDMELAIMLHTYREDLLEQVKKGERLAIFGQLAASIGHELRNPLSVINSSVHILKARVTEPRLLEHLKKIERQVDSSNRIISTLLDMVREVPARRSAVVLDDVVALACDAALPGTPLRLTLDVPKGLPALWVDADQLKQILINLLVNAEQAASPSGEILLKATHAGGFVTILVNDSGPGIDETVRARLFEPLTTTKSHGVGLGLALCRRFAEGNSGSIALSLGPLKGAAFELRMPIAV